MLLIKRIFYFILLFLFASDIFCSDFGLESKQNMNNLLCPNDNFALLDKKITFEIEDMCENITKEIPVIISLEEFSYQKLKDCFELNFPNAKNLKYSFWLRNKEKIKKNSHYKVQDLSLIQVRFFKHCEDCNVEKDGLDEKPITTSFDCMVSNESKIPKIEILLKDKKNLDEKVILVESKLLIPYLFFMVQFFLLLKKSFMARHDKNETK